MARQDLSTIRSRDAEENAQGRLPAGEGIDVPCIWVVECYPPSKVAALVAGLRSLGLDRPWMGMDRGGAVDWVLSSRGRGFAGAWANLGFFTRPGHRLLGADQVTTDLPPGTEHAAASLFALTPSLTALVVQFVLSRELGEDLASALNREYRTEVRRSARGIIYDGPDQQRRREVKATFADGRRQASGWIAQHLPGWFASGPDDMPTCAFVTTQAARPFDPAARQRWNSYVGALGLDADHEAWDLTPFPGLALRVSDREESARHWLLAGRVGAFMSDDIQGAYGGPTRHGWSNRLWHETSSMVADLGALTLLRDFHVLAATARDAVAEPSRRRRNGGRRFELLPTVVSSISADVEPIAAELAVERDVRHMVDDLRSAVPGAGNIFRIIDAARPVAPAKKRSLIARLRARLGRARSSAELPAQTTRGPRVQNLAQVVGEEIQLSAVRLLHGAQRTRTALATTATLASAVETLRLDRRLFRLSVVLGVIAVLAAFPAVATLLSAVLRAAGIDVPEFEPQPTSSPSG